MHSLTSRGILASSHQSHEWQQTDGGPDANSDFRRNFLRNGFGVAESGELEPLHNDPANLSHFMSQMAPRWHALTKEADIRAARYGQTVTQDNVGNYYGVFHERSGPVLPQSQMPYGGGFSWGPWINTKFVEAYGNNGRDLPPLPNGSSFSLVSYVAGLRAKGLTPEELTREPILHEYIRFTQNTTVGRWVDLRRGAKAQAAKEDRPFPLGVYGNLECMAFQAKDACAWAQNRQPVMTAQFVDVIVLEASMTIPEFKVALAAGNFEKPVFPYPDTCPDPCEGPSAVARAMGVVPASTTSHARWYGVYRHLFTDRRSVADVAVLLDLPVFFWRGFSSLAWPGNQPHVLAMQNITALLDEEHTPYDVIFEGHADFYDDTKHWARLKSYSTLILPRVESISDAHVEQIRLFAAGGGHVVVLGDVSGLFDQEDRPRARPAFEALRSKGAVTFVNDTVFGAFMENVTAESSRSAIIRALQLNEDPLIETDFPPTVNLAMWLHGNGPMLSVQFGNGDIHRTSHETDNTSFALSMRVHHEPNVKLEAWFYSWSLPGGAPVRLPFHIGGERINVTVPPFARFGAVVIGALGEPEIRAEAGMVQKLTSRLELASTVTPGQSATPAGLSSARALLKEIQGPYAATLYNPSHTLLSKLNAIVIALNKTLRQVHNDSIEFNFRSRSATTNSKGLVRIDLGAGPATPGWNHVGANTSFTPGAAGWLGEQSYAFGSPAPAALSRKGSSGLPQPCPFMTDAVLCSYLYSNSSQRSDLRVTLPHPGNFTVELVMGEPTSMLTRVALSYVWDSTGELLGVGQRMPASGEFTSIAFSVAVPVPTAGRLPTVTLSLGGMSVAQYFEFDDRSTGVGANGRPGNESHYDLLGWLVNAIIIRESSAPLPLAAAASLHAHKVMASGIRDWWILGALDDSNASCMDNPSMADSEPVPLDWLNLSRSYPRKGGGQGLAAWQRVTLNGSLAYLDLLQHGVRDSNQPAWGASALALTHVQNTGNTPKRVALVGSTTGVGMGWLGATEVFRDQLNTGLLVREEHVEVVLQPGWNRLTVRACTNWGAEGWGIWMGLQNLAGGRVDGIRVNACGPLCRLKQDDARVLNNSDLASVTVHCADRFNCTEPIQTALDFGASSITISNGHGSSLPMSVEPLFVRRSDCTITLSPGVELLAMAGQFHGLYDSLVTVINASNVTLIATGATLRMRKSDYLPPLYKKGEWRMALQIRASRGVTVIGGRYIDAGGDAVYIDGGAGLFNPPSNIVLDGLYCDSAWRNGMSVISAVNLTVRNSVFIRTNGTNPQCGIDLEPDGPTDRLQGIVFSNITLHNNQKCGFAMSLYAIVNSSQPVDITIESMAITDVPSTAYSWGAAPTRWVGGYGLQLADAYNLTGTFRVRNLSISDTFTAAIYVVNWPAGSILMSFDGLMITRCAAGTTQPEVPIFGSVSPIVLFPLSCDQSCNATQRCPWQTDAQLPAGGMSFKSTTIDTPTHRPWLSRMWDGLHSHADSRFGQPGSLADISGVVQVVDGSGSKCVEANVGSDAGNITVKVVCSGI
jgi:hypothetical protein